MSFLFEDARPSARLYCAVSPEVVAGFAEVVAESFPATDIMVEAPGDDAPVPRQGRR